MSVRGERERGGGRERGGREGVGKKKERKREGGRKTLVLFSKHS